MHTYKAHFLFMIEITTGVIFLMTSLYGSAQAETFGAPSVMKSNEIAKTTATTSSLMTREDMEAYLKDEYSDTPILVDIARCESTFKQYQADGRVVRGLIDNDDIGLMQINERYHGETAKKLGLDIYKVDGNIEYAKYLYKKFGTQPWSASSKCWSGSRGDLAMI